MFTSCGIGGAKGLCCRVDKPAMLVEGETTLSLNRNRSIRRDAIPIDAEDVEADQLRVGPAAPDDGVASLELLEDGVVEQRRHFEGRRVLRPRPRAVDGDHAAAAAPDAAHVDGNGVTVAYKVGEGDAEAEGEGEGDEEPKRRTAGERRGARQRDGVTAARHFLATRILEFDDIGPVTSARDIFSSSADFLVAHSIFCFRSPLCPEELLDGYAQSLESFFALESLEHFWTQEAWRVCKFFLGGGVVKFFFIFCCLQNFFFFKLFFEKPF